MYTKDIDLTVEINIFERENKKIVIALNFILL